MASFWDKKKPPGPPNGGSKSKGLAACMSPEGSIPAEPPALPKARSEHNCSGTRWEQSMTTDLYVALRAPEPSGKQRPGTALVTAVHGMKLVSASALSRGTTETPCCGRTYWWREDASAPAVLSRAPLSTTAFSSRVLCFLAAAIGRASRRDDGTPVPRQAGRPHPYTKGPANKKTTIPRAPLQRGSVLPVSAAPRLRTTLTKARR